MTSPSIRIVNKIARLVDLIFGVNSKQRNKVTKILIVELFVRKNTNKIKISASQPISIKNCINYDHNKNFWAI